MCDNQYNNYCWQHSFYHQYMQQHAAMMQWIQSLHSNVNTQDVNNVNQTCEGSLHCPKTVHYDCKVKEYISSNESTSSSSEYSSSDTSSNSDSGIKEPENVDTDEEEESEWEFELNVDAILAMRQAKEELKKEASSDSSSIVMVDREEFELVELGSAQQTEAKRSVLAGGLRDRNAELQYEKELKEYLYGEKFTTIAGLETAMSLTYERLCDINQPPLWPVYPLRLTSSVK